jgi:hypothetical protein
MKMNMTESDTYLWTANDWSNIITISSAALASVLLVLFKSRCSEIRVCWGLWSCTRQVQETEASDEERPTPQPDIRRDDAEPGA